MKFRAEPKDIIIFVLFCILLLILVGIGVLNLSYLANFGTFYGINPIEAFSPQYLGSTISFFVMALIGIIVTCNSYFFDREKGFGLVTKKKDKGYSRWAKDSEMKKELKQIDIRADNLNHAGIPMISDGKHMWVDDGESHTLVVGATGSGKTVIVAKPMIKILAKAGESMIVTDPKGELYEQSGQMLKDKGYNVIVLNFRDPQRGNAWNPMTLPYRLYKEGNMDKSLEILDDLAANILYDEKTTNDPFWEKSSADYFSGLALGLFEDGTEEEVNLNSINLMSSLGEERFGGPNNNYIKEYFNAKDPSRPAYVNASGVVYAPEETKGGVVATFKQKVRLFSSRDNLSEMLSYSDFEMKDIGRKKTAVFLIIQDEKKTLHPLATIFIKQCYETLIDVAQECGGHLPYRTNFILDEFANMPPLKDVTTMVTAARSRHIRFTFIIQNYAQLTQVYGKENGETIKGNCNIMYLISNELSALEEISKMAGEVKSKEKDKTASTPLVTVSDLQRLNKFEIIVLRMRMMPYKTRFKTDFEVDWGKSYPKAEYTEREKREIKLFEIREFVKKMKAEKAAQMMGQGMNNMPFTGGMNQGPSFMPYNNMMGMNPMPMGTNPNMPMGSSSPLLPNYNQPLNNGMNPFNPMGNNIPQNNGSATPFNVDDLVKRIDAKIAELEAEEAAEKEKNKAIGQIEPEKIEVAVPKKDIVEINKTTTIEKEESSLSDLSYNNFKHDEDVKEIEDIKEAVVTDTISNEEINEDVVNTNEKDDKKDNISDDDDFFDDFFDDEG